MLDSVKYILSTLFQKATQLEIMLSGHLIHLSDLVIILMKSSPVFPKTLSPLLSSQAD